MRGANQHLSGEEIEQLTSIAPDEAVGALEGAMRHLERCEQCRFRMLLSEQDLSSIRQLASGGTPRTSSDCPPEDRWLEVAAGLGTKAERKRLMEHAATCARCGPLLKQAVEDVSMELTAQEETKVAALASADAKWQSDLAKKIAGTPPKVPVPKPARKFVFWPRWAAAFAALVVATGGGWWAWILLRAPSVEELLAQAYTEQRTIEMRIPGAKYAPMRVERGPGESNLKKRPALLKAEGLIAEGLQKSPNDPVLLQANARADLLDGNYNDAIKSLQLALLTRPDSPDLLADLGSAYFQRGEATGVTGDYGQAVESLAKALSKSPNNPVILFNHALACEKLFFYTQAIDDWQHYLSLDPKGGWADEAHTNLKRVQEKMAEREKRAAVPLLSPTELTALIDSNRETANATLDARVERYLEAAIQSWLPQAYSSSSSQGTVTEARRALDYLAEILKARHDDTWLADFFRNQPDQGQVNAIQSLLASEEARRSGQYDLSIRLARESIREFQRSGNQAGMLRASFSLMLAQSFAFRTNDCLKTAADVIPALSTTSYRWLQIQLLIQQGLCQYVAPQVDSALRSTVEGAKLAKLFHYPGLELRAIAFSAACRRDTGSANRGLRDLISGLAMFWQADVISTRGENLYSVLFNTAESRNWLHIEVLALAEKIADFPINDPVDQAVNFELLAGAQERIGDYEAAQVTLQHSAALLAALPEDSGITLRRAEIELENAGIQLHLGDPQGALATLASLRQQFEIGDALSRAEYLRTYGEAYLAIGLPQSAQPLLERALAVADAAIEGLGSEADKLQWSRTQGQVYRDLMEIKLKFGVSAEAFALWEWYKGASQRSATIKDSRALSVQNHSLSPPAVSSYELAPDTILVSYALLKKSATAFVFHGGLVQSHTLQMPDDLELQILRFLSLCTDPTSDLHSFKIESRHLYETLIAPLESYLQSAAALRFETDGILDRIPFGLLLGPDGRYLADRFELTYSPGLAYQFQSKIEKLSSSSAALIVVPAGMQEPVFAPLPDTLDEARDVAKYFFNAKILPGSDAARENVLRNLRDAEVFHFVGHAQAAVDQVGLVLGPGALLSSQDLVNLRLRNLRLAVLSACETANGDEGSFSDVNSVARALAVAGVPQIVASRWKVDSVATRLLMRSFYSNLMFGKSAADSLRVATAEVRSLPRYQHPYYWGSFAVFGG